MWGVSLDDGLWSSHRGRVVVVGSVGDSRGVSLSIGAGWWEVGRCSGIRVAVVSNGG